MSAVKTTPPPARAGWLDRYFHITERGSTVGTEIRGGLTTFLTMVYIVVLNPLILGSVKDGTGAYLGGGDQAQAMLLVAGATALVAGLLTILMGVYGRSPVALAAGLGLNAYVAFGIASLPGMTWPAAMGLVVIEGFIVLLLVLTKFRLKVLQALPMGLKLGVSAGIGAFIVLIGLWDAGIVTAGTGTPFQLGVNGSLKTWPILVFVLTILVLLGLMARKVRGAILYSIVGGTALAMLIESVFGIGSKVAAPGGWGLNVPVWPSEIVSVPNLALLGQFSLTEAVSTLGFFVVLPIVLALLMVDFFDTIGTLTAISVEADLLDKDGNPEYVQQQLVVDSLGAMAGGAASVSSNTAYIESASGVGDGARTGLANVVTGAMFLVAMFFTPLVTVVPFEAATPALVVVGSLMVIQFFRSDLSKFEVSVPGAIILLTVPFTYSIASGIGFGVLAYLVIMLAQGKVRKVPPLLWVIGLLFILYFVLL